MATNQRSSDDYSELTRIADAAVSEGLFTESGDDRLIAELRRQRRLRDEAEDRLRLLIAYARGHVRPRTYTLAALAEAAGLSISGVRTYYTPQHLDRVTAVLRETQKSA